MVAWSCLFKQTNGEWNNNNNRLLANWVGTVSQSHSPCSCPFISNNNIMVQTIIIIIIYGLHSSSFWCTWEGSGIMWCISYRDSLGRGREPVVCGHKSCDCHQLSTRQVTRIQFNFISIKTHTQKNAGKNGTGWIHPGNDWNTTLTMQ